MYETLKKNLKISLNSNKWQNQNGNFLEEPRYTGDINVIGFKKKSHQWPNMQKKT